MSTNDIDLEFARDIELPPFQFECIQNLFGSIEEPLERLEAIITWAGESDMHVAHVRVWVDSWNANCARFIIAISYDEWFYLFEPHRRKHYSWNEDRFVPRGTEAWTCRVAQLKTIVGFLMSCSRYTRELTDVRMWLHMGKRTSSC